MLKLGADFGEEFFLAESEEETFISAVCFPPGVRVSIGLLALFAMAMPVTTSRAAEEPGRDAGAKNPAEDDSRQADPKAVVEKLGSNQAGEVTLAEIEVAIGHFKREAKTAETFEALKRLSEFRGRRIAREIDERLEGKSAEEKKAGWLAFFAERFPADPYAAFQLLSSSRLLKSDGLSSRQMMDALPVQQKTVMRGYAMFIVAEWETRGKTPAPFPGELPAPGFSLAENVTAAQFLPVIPARQPAAVSAPAGNPPAVAKKNDAESALCEERRRNVGMVFKPRSLNTAVFTVMQQEVLDYDCAKQQYLVFVVEELRVFSRDHPKVVMKWIRPSALHPVKAGARKTRAQRVCDECRGHGKLEKVVGEVLTGGEQQKGNYIIKNSKLVYQWYPCAPCKGEGMR